MHAFASEARQKLSGRRVVDDNDEIDDLPLSQWSKVVSIVYLSKYGLVCVCLLTAACLPRPALDLLQSRRLSVLHKPFSSFISRTMIK